MVGFLVGALSIQCSFQKIVSSAVNLHQLLTSQNVELLNVHSGQPTYAAHIRLVASAISDCSVGNRDMRDGINATFV